MGVRRAMLTSIRANRASFIYTHTMREGVGHAVLEYGGEEVIQKRQCHYKCGVLCMSCVNCLFSGMYNNRDWFLGIKTCHNTYIFIN